MKLLEVERNPLGYRVRVCQCRVHHGAVGVLMVLWGAYLVGRDIADFPWVK